jgi:hypothetical protein
MEFVVVDRGVGRNGNASPAPNTMPATMATAAASTAIQ